MGQLDVAQLLLDRGAKVNQALTSGYTPLFIAAEKGQLALAKLLIEAGADVNQARRVNHPRRDVVTPLLTAEENDHTAIVDLLKKHQAFEKNISAGDKKRIINEIARGYNIRTRDICLAIEKGKTDIALYFIEQVQDVNILNGNCEVPLVEDTLEGNSRVIKALLDKGADPNLQNSNERSAIDVARIKGNKKLQKLFTPTAKTVTASSPYSAGAAEEMPSAPPYESTIQYQGKLAKAKPVDVVETPPVVAPVVDENPPLSHVARLHRERANPAIQSCCSIS